MSITPDTDGPDRSALAERGVEASQRAAKRTADALRSQAARAREVAKTYAGKARDQSVVARRKLSEAVRERPIVSTGAALAAGVLAGLLLAGGRSRRHRT